MPPALPVDGPTLAEVKLEWIREEEPGVSLHLSMKRTQIANGDGWSIIIIVFVIQGFLFEEIVFEQF